MAIDKRPLVLGQGAATVSVTPPNAFIGWAGKPTAAGLCKALGPAKPAWDGLIAHMASQHDVTVLEWKSYSLKAGWAAGLKRGKRTILHLGPCQGCFRVLFILGDKALQAARQCGLSARALQTLDQAQKYPEGTGIRLLIRRPRDLPAVKKLAVVKLEN